MKAWATSVSLMMISTGGCATNEDPPVVTGEHHQYVVSELRIPRDNNEARANSLDLNNDKTVDNQLGMVFGTLDSMGLGVGETATEALLRGGLVMLADLQTENFELTEASGFETWLGDVNDPSACLDPARLETCGQHLRGTGRFSVDEDSASHQISGPIVDGVFLQKAVFLPVELVLDAGRPLRVDLRGARVKLTQISETKISAVFAGGLTKLDLERVVYPEAAANCDRIVQNECMQASSEECGCLPGSRARTLQSLFDDNHDCRITTHEVATNTLVQALLAPDLRIDGQDLVSFGVGVELVPASF